MKTSLEGESQETKQTDRVVKEKLKVKEKSTPTSAQNSRKNNPLPSQAQNATPLYWNQNFEDANMSEKEFRIPFFFSVNEHKWIH